MHLEPIALTRKFGTDRHSGLAALTTMVQARIVTARFLASIGDENASSAPPSYSDGSAIMTRDRSDKLDTATRRARARIAKSRTVVAQPRPNRLGHRKTQQPSRKEDEEIERDLDAKE